MGACLRITNFSNALGVVICYTMDEVPIRAESLRQSSNVLSNFSPLIFKFRLINLMNDLIGRRGAQNDLSVFTRRGMNAIEMAGREAAIEDGIISGVVDPVQNKSANLRRGKWTPEEEAYSSRLIAEFKAGKLPLTDGTTLRTFLSKLLNCDPMRISKKFVGKNCVGKVIM